MRKGILRTAGALLLSMGVIVCTWGLPGQAGVKAREGEALSFRVTHEQKDSSIKIYLENDSALLFKDAQLQVPKKSKLKYVAQKETLNVRPKEKLAFNVEITGLNEAETKTSDSRPTNAAPSQTAAEEISKTGEQHQGLLPAVILMGSGMTLLIFSLEKKKRKKSLALLLTFSFFWPASTLLRAQEEEKVVYAYEGTYSYQDVTETVTFTICFTPVLNESTEDTSAATETTESTPVASSSEAEPTPSKPAATEPKPTEPRPTAPKPTEPKPTEPKPTETTYKPNPTTVKPTPTPKPSEPKATEPKPTETTSKPNPTTIKPTPRPTEPKPTETQIKEIKRTKEEKNYKGNEIAYTSKTIEDPSQKKGTSGIRTKGENGYTIYYQERDRIEYSNGSVKYTDWTTVRTESKDPVQEVKWIGTKEETSSVGWNQAVMQAVANKLTEVRLQKGLATNITWDKTEAKKLAERPVFGHLDNDNECVAYSGWNGITPAEVIVNNIFTGWMSDSHAEQILAEYPEWVVGAYNYRGNVYVIIYYDLDW